MTKTYIFVALRILLAFAVPGAAHGAPGPAGAFIATAVRAACLENDQRTECGAPRFTVALAHQVTPTHPRFHGAERPATPPPPARSSDRDEDPLATMHFE